MVQRHRDLSDNLDLVISDTRQYLENVDHQLGHWTRVNFDRELTEGFGSAVDNLAAGMELRLAEINEPQYTGMTRITGLPPFLLKQCMVRKDQYVTYLFRLPFLLMRLLPLLVLSLFFCDNVAEIYRMQVCNTFAFLLYQKVFFSALRGSRTCHHRGPLG